MSRTEDAGDYGGTCDTCSHGIAKAGHSQCANCERQAAEVDEHIDRTQGIRDKPMTPLSQIEALLKDAVRRGWDIWRSTSGIDEDQPDIIAAEVLKVLAYLALMGRTQDGTLALGPEAVDRMLEHVKRLIKIEVEATGDPAPPVESICVVCNKPAKEHGQFGFRDHAPRDLDGNELPDGSAPGDTAPRRAEPEQSHVDQLRTLYTPVQAEPPEAIK